MLICFSLYHRNLKIEHSTCVFKLLYETCHSEINPTTQNMQFVNLCYKKDFFLNFTFSFTLNTQAVVDFCRLSLSNFSGLLGVIFWRK